jgi:hypothetical protein
VFVHSRFVENPLIDLEATGPSFLRWFYHNNEHRALLLVSSVSIFYSHTELSPVDRSLGCHRLSPFLKSLLEKKIVYHMLAYEGDITIKKNLLWDGIYASIQSWFTIILIMGWTIIPVYLKWEIKTLLINM